MGKLGMAVPHLTTALTGPLYEIEARLLDKQAEIEHWFRQQFVQSPAPIYASVDLRNAGFKLAPVDTNLFPAGFNNLNASFKPVCAMAMQAAIERVCSSACRIMIVPENHTRNLFYLESLSVLQEILTLGGFRSRIGSLREDLKEPETIDLPSGKQITLEPVIRRGERAGLKDFDPCFILLNNDLSGGRPKILEGLEQPVKPPLALGWADRLKTDHFTIYQELALEFAELLDIDPWLIDPIFRSCGKIDFKKPNAQDCLAENIGKVLQDISIKYREYGITEEPFVIVKSDTGTYGMNVMTVRNPKEVLEMNRKQRNKMAKGKEGAEVSNILIQEGVHTFEKWGDSGATAEPVVYMIGHSVVGGFYRVHGSKDQTQSLNAPGAVFQPLNFASSCSMPNCNLEPDAEPNRFYAYGVIARLALLAAAREVANISKKAPV